MIEEINMLMNDLDISGEHAEEIINTYFECYADTWVYNDFLTEEIRVLRDKDYASIRDSLENMDDISLFGGDDYVLITNYQTLLKMNGGLDIFPEHSF